jgi:hypothetical protein
LTVGIREIICASAIAEAGLSAEELNAVVSNEEERLELAIAANRK